MASNENTVNSATVTVYHGERSADGSLNIYASNKTSADSWIKIDVHGAKTEGTLLRAKLPANANRVLVGKVKSEADSAYSFRFSNQTKPFAQKNNGHGITDKETPFYVQNETNSCGHTCLQMCASKINSEENASVQKIGELGNIEHQKYSYPAELALAGDKLGYKTEAYGKKWCFNGKASNATRTAQVKQQCTSRKVAVTEGAQGSLTVDQICTKLGKEEQQGMVLLDWNKLKQEMHPEKYPASANMSYCGHWVPIAGYDDENMYVHNQSKSDGELGGPYVRIPKSKFDVARKHKTGEGIVFLRPKPAE